MARPPSKRGESRLSASDHAQGGHIGRSRFGPTHGSPLSRTLPAGESSGSGGPNGGTMTKRKLQAIRRGAALACALAVVLSGVGAYFFADTATTEKKAV